MERFLVGEKVPQTFRNSVNMAALGVDGVLPSPGVRRRATASRREGETGEGEREGEGEGEGERVFSLQLERLSSSRLV